MKPSVYAAGPINGLSYDKAVERREYLAKALHPDITVHSPMRWKAMLKGQPKIDNGGALYEQPLTRAAGIVTRDRYDVMRSDLMLADLEFPPTAEGWFKELRPGLFSMDRLELVSCGTPVEFGWADAFRKPIVTILKDGSAYDHPFIRHLSGYIVDSLDDAIDVVKAVLLDEGWHQGSFFRQTFEQDWDQNPCVPLSDGLSDAG